MRFLPTFFFSFFIYLFFLISHPSSLFHRERYSMNPSPAGLGNFLRNWSIRFPQGHRGREGEGRAGTWLARAARPRLGAGGPPRGGCISPPPQPLPFHPAPRQLRNPGAD